MRLERLLLAVVVVGVTAVVSAQSKAVVWPAAAIKWTDSTTAPGAKAAVLWGDPTKGAYGALKQIPAGSTLPAHTHGNDSHVVMVKGSITLDMEGKKTTLGPGSYALIPAGVPHTPTCGAGAACEYFEHMNAAFDSTAAKH
jgi:quercetin dioxygenase-like cupin family protein